MNEEQNKYTIVFMFFVVLGYVRKRETAALGTYHVALHKTNFQDITPVDNYQESVNIIIDSTLKREKPLAEFFVSCLECKAVICLKVCQHNAPE